ncbi:hypothetical protein T07_6147 [Trichinella nelsoni]|uniref:Uncharacterized protein n=1 Tax=Trichinella nelsoni TaxID=6336 RepID=A0A0V0S4K7_9BILA|nr:hypothetical protein T07_6147 [Trichinella nelsoni]
MNGNFPQYSDAMRSASHAIWRTVDTFSVQQQVEIKLSRKSYCRASCKDYLPAHCCFLIKAAVQHAHTTVQYKPIRTINPNTTRHLKAGRIYN